MNKVKKDLDIVSENDGEIIAFCPFHNDNKRANLIINKIGEFAGYYHCFACGAHGKAAELNIKRDWRKTSKNYPKIDWEGVNAACVNKLQGSDLKYLAKKWNIHPLVLTGLDCGWNGAAYTFPIKNENNRIIGIQRRYETKELSGLKLSMEYSKVGLFVPKRILFAVEDIIFITEGLSDLAILLDLGFIGVGRFNALARIDMTVKWLSNYVASATKCIIIADTDDAGIRGARKLTRESNRKNIQWMLPQQGNDLRHWVELEGKEKVKSYLKNHLQD